MAARSLLFNALFYLVAGVGLVLMLVPSFLLPRRAGVALGNALVRLVLALLRVTVGLTHRVEGDVEQLRRPGLIAAKHQSAWDTLVFFALCPDVAYVMKRELLWLPVYGWLAWWLGHLPVDRRGGGKAVRALLRAAERAHADGRQIVIFPQGTRVAPGATAPYQPGIAALYGHLKLPVVPVALNSGRFWGRRSFAKRPGVITVQVLPEIPPGLPRAAFLAELERRIETASAALAIAPP